MRRGTEQAQNLGPRTIPALHIDEPEVSIDPGDGHLEALARQTIAALIKYPHAIVISGTRAAAGADGMPDVVTLARAITHLLGGRSIWARFSFTEIKVNPAINTIGRVGTNYSQTHAGIAPHSDSSWLQSPPNLWGLQCVEADQSGGDTLIVPVEDILRRLSKATIQALRQPVFPFADGVFKPVLSGRRGDQRISYYDAQLSKGATTQQDSLDGTSQSALHELGQAVSDPEIALRLKLEAGDLVFMNNHKALHGRTAFIEESGRLLFRLRANVDFPTSQLSFNPIYQRILKRVRHRNTYFQTTGPDCFEAVFMNSKGIFSKQTMTSTEGLIEFANTMLRQGQFSLAVPAFEEVLHQMPKNLDASRSLSCLLEHLGEREKAELVLKQAVAVTPYQVSGDLRAGLPVILRTRGLKNRDRKLRRRINDYVARLSGGHYSLKHLLNGEEVNVIVMNLYDNSLNLAFPAPPFHLLLNTLSVPERMEDELEVLVKLLERYPGIPVINHPARIMLTTREENYRRLSTLDGVVFPKTIRFSHTGNALYGPLDRMRAAELQFPMILRPTTTHTGLGVALISDVNEFGNYLASHGPGRYYAIAYHNLKDERGLFNKLRAFSIDGNWYPVTNAYHRDWMVHSFDRYHKMKTDSDLQQEEKSFLRDMVSYIGSNNMKRLERIEKIIGLDFFGIDFTVLPDGRLFVFECNAAMRHHFDHAESFPYTAPASHAVTDAFGEMITRRLSRHAGHSDCS